MESPPHYFGPLYSAIWHSGKTGRFLSTARASQASAFEIVPICRLMDQPIVFRFAIATTNRGNDPVIVETKPVSILVDVRGLNADNALADRILPMAKQPAMPVHDMALKTESGRREGSDTVRHGPGACCNYGQSRHVTIIITCLKQPAFWRFVGAETNKFKGTGT